MKDFFDKEEYTQEDIIRIVSEKWEESLNLEFKSSEALINTEPNKKEISKDVSAFANSAGGIVIYGIRQNNNVAEGITFADGNTITKEWLEQVVHSNIHRKIDNILIFPIRFGSEITKSVYLVKIPESNEAPHMARDKKYYKRYNFESVAMEEYEVRNLYHRLQRTELSIVYLQSQARGARMGRPRNYTYYSFEINFIIKNISDSIEKNFKVELKIPSVLIFDTNARLEQYLILSEAENKIYSVHNQSPLFQGEETSLCPIYIRVNKTTFRDDSNFKIDVRLYYSNGSKDYSYDLRDSLTIDGEAINEAVFANPN